MAQLDEALDSTDRASLTAESTADVFGVLSVAEVTKSLFLIPPILTSHEKSPPYG